MTYVEPFGCSLSKPCASGTRKTDVALALSPVESSLSHAHAAGYCVTVLLFQELEFSFWGSNDVAFVLQAKPANTMHCQQATYPTFSSVWKWYRGSLTISLVVASALSSIKTFSLRSQTGFRSCYMTRMHSTFVEVSANQEWLSMSKTEWRNRRSEVVECVLLC